MEFANFTMNFLQIFAIVLLVVVIASFIFKNQKALITLLTKFIILVFVNVFVFTQLEFIRNHYRNYSYVLFVLLILAYFIFIRDFISYLKSKKPA
ncbi:hypothetical protein [Lysinibacillus sp. 3P01SB]|uniref:hypothetical protein n=1 Tax=Lysinibacillus sp. 3P01SB TaxID=3132284 RepID=UPI0039A5BDD4